MTKNIINDPLTSWNNGINKQIIINFVESVTDPQNSNYVKPKNRIAMFDNDGTLWTEKPVYFQVAFILNRIQNLAPQYPE